MVNHHRAILKVEPIPEYDNMPPFNNRKVYALKKGLYIGKKLSGKEMIDKKIKELEFRLSARSNQ